MKIAVMGAGAVGCYFGGLLARAGHDVLLIGRPALVQAVQAAQPAGLRLQTRHFDATVPVRASASVAAVRDADLVLCCVKSTDTEDAGAAMAPHLQPAATVLSLQNGVDNAQRLGAALGRPAQPVVVYVATEMAGPGHVLHHGRGELVIGPWGNMAEAAGCSSDDVVALFATAAVPVQVSDNVVGALWAKLIVNCAYNALSAIARLPYGRLVQGAGVTDVMHDVVQECLSVARAQGVQVPGDVGQAVQAIARTMAGQYSSTAQDLMRGKRSEIDHLNGYVVRLGASLGVATPANRVLQALVRLLESPPPSPEQATQESPQTPPQDHQP